MDIPFRTAGPYGGSHAVLRSTISDALYCHAHPCLRSSEPGSPISRPQREWCGRSRPYGVGPSTVRRFRKDFTPSYELRAPYQFLCLIRNAYRVLAFRQYSTARGSRYITLTNFGAVLVIRTPYSSPRAKGKVPVCLARGAIPPTQTANWISVASSILYDRFGNLPAPCAYGVTLHTPRSQQPHDDLCLSFSLLSALRAMGFGVHR